MQNKLIFPLYFDNNATTSLDPLVLETMLEEMRRHPANPSSQHTWGREAKKRLEDAREEVASHFSFAPTEVFFTSGGTENANLFCHSLPVEGHLISTKIEHSCLFQNVQALEKKGVQVTYLPVGPSGAPKIEELQKAFRNDTKALLFSAANNETGVKLDVEAFAALAKEKNTPLFLDAVAWVGKEPLPSHPGITALSISAHKFHGPKGAGALLCRKKFPLSPLLLGGGQEKGVRSGSENLPAILGMTTALRLALQRLSHTTPHLLSLQNAFESQLRRGFPPILVQGTDPRIANTSALSFPKVDGESLLIELDRAGIFASHGSACSSGARQASRVLLEMGVPHSLALSSIRFSFSKDTTLEEVDEGAQRLLSLKKIFF